MAYPPPNPGYPPPSSTGYPLPAPLGSAYPPPNPAYPQQPPVSISIMQLYCRMQSCVHTSHYTPNLPCAQQHQHSQGQACVGQPRTTQFCDRVQLAVGRSPLLFDAGVKARHSGYTSVGTHGVQSDHLVTELSCSGLAHTGLVLPMLMLLSTRQVRCVYSEMYAHTTT